MLPRLTKVLRKLGVTAWLCVGVVIALLAADYLSDGEFDFDVNEVLDALDELPRDDGSGEGTGEGSSIDTGSADARHQSSPLDPSP